MGSLFRKPPKPKASENVPEFREDVSLVVVGDGSVGKSTLILSYGNDKYTDATGTTFRDIFWNNITYNGHDVKIKIWDTAGQQEFRAMNDEVFKEAHCFIICFDLSSKITLDNAFAYWQKELKLRGQKNTPIVLCGTKKDKRDMNLEMNKREDQVTT